MNDGAKKTVAGHMARAQCAVCPPRHPYAAEDEGEEKQRMHACDTCARAQRGGRGEEVTKERRAKDGDVV